MTIINSYKRNINTYDKTNNNKEPGEIYPWHNQCCIKCKKYQESTDWQNLTQRFQE